MNWSDIAAAAATLFFVMDRSATSLCSMPCCRALRRGGAHRSRRASSSSRSRSCCCFFLPAWRSDFLGLSQPSLNIAGGVLLFIIALRMIFPHLASEVASEKDEPFIVPLAMPMVAGPSTIAILLLLSSSEPERIWEWCTALVIAWVVTTVLLTASPFLLRVLGDRGRVPSSG